MGLQKRFWEAQTVKYYIGRYLKMFKFFLINQNLFNLRFSCKVGVRWDNQKLRGSFDQPSFHPGDACQKWKIGEIVRGMDSGSRMPVTGTRYPASGTRHHPFQIRETFLLPYERVSIAQRSRYLIIICLGVAFISLQSKYFLFSLDFLLNSNQLS